MRSRRRLAARWGILAVGALAVCACNAVSGVNDLEFGEDTPAPAPAIGEPPSDMGGETQGVNPLLPCSALTGGGCPAEQTCRLSRTSGEPPSCVPLLASVLEPYAACREDAECPAAHACAAGLCSRLCESAADCAEPNARCVPDDSGLFSRCTRSCDLVTPAAPRSGLQACGAGARCDFVPESGGAGYTDCVPVTGGFDGSACETDAACPVGFLCQRQRCVPACDPDGAACPGGGSCNDVASRAGQSVGGCCNIPDGQACNLITDCGCAQAQTCSTPDALGNSFCRSLRDTPLAPYSACSADEDCPRGHSCLGGACKRHCRTLADCAGEGTACLSVFNGGVPVPGASACARGCDLLEPVAADTGFRACGPQANCVFFGTNTDCVSSGPGTQNSSCEVSQDCAPGFLCYRNTCERWCDPNASVCEAGTFCGGIINAVGRQLGSCCRPPAGQVCDWVTDCGCSPSETCAIDAANTRFCRALAQTPVALFGLCSSDDECPAGTVCLGNNCMPRCSASADCGTDVQCIPLLDTAEVQLTGVCSRNCDVLSATAPAAGLQPCAAGLRCSDTTGIDGGASFCSAPGPLAAGEVCASFADCGAGLSCEDGLCAELCELGTSCPDGADCSVRPFDIPAIGGRQIGFCPAGGG